MDCAESARRTWASKASRLIFIPSPNARPAAKRDTEFRQQFIETHGLAPCHQFLSAGLPPDPKVKAVGTFVGEAAVSAAPSPTSDYDHLQSVSS